MASGDSLKVAISLNEINLIGNVYTFLCDMKVRSIRSCDTDIIDSSYQYIKEKTTQQESQ